MKLDCFALSGLAMTIILCLLLAQPVSAEPDSEVIRDLLLQSDVEAVIKLIEEDHDKTKSKKWELGVDNTRYYAISLITMGNVADAEKFLQEAIAKYPKEKEFKDIYNHIFFFNEEFEKAFPDKIAKQHIELIEFIKQDKSQTKKIIKAIDDLDANLPYFLTQTDYLLELANEETLKLAEKEAFAIITSNRKKLFPMTMNFYELASAYKALAVIALKSGNVEDATKYIKLARENIYKMRAIWLEEDIIVYRPILKINKRSTKFGFALPQWLILLREEYDNYLLP